MKRTPLNGRRAEHAECRTCECHGPRRVELATTGKSLEPHPVGREHVHKPVAFTSDVVVLEGVPLAERHEQGAVNVGLPARNPVDQRACVERLHESHGATLSAARGCPRSVLSLPSTHHTMSLPPFQIDSTEDLPTSSAASARSAHARRLFAGIALSYEWVATLLSLGQDPRWRRALVATVRATSEDRVLDVATGTGMVARALAARYGCRVVGLDQSPDMLAAGLADGHPLVTAQGERLPFPDASFDHVTFTYLLRYVEDPAATVRELARVMRPGGRLAMLEFGVPQNAFWRFMWRLYTRIGLPVAGRLLSPSWGAVGDFLGPSIERFYSLHPQAELERDWCAAGLESVTVERMSLGGGTVMSATKSRPIQYSPPPPPTSSSTSAPNTPSAFYALRPGGWRDYWTLLHPPYTAWHLSYVLLGAALAPAPDPRIVVGALVTFGLAVGIGAHAFDELQGRPLGTRIPSRVLFCLGATALGLAAALGVVASIMIGATYLAIVALGLLLVISYGLEITPVHTDIGFALAWGSFPVVATAYALGAPPLATGLAALGAALLSLAQRRLSTPVRTLRRRVVDVSGQISYRDGSVHAVNRQLLLAPSEGALRLLWLSIGLLSSGVLAARWL
jgi:demethylmenaquinone methyltransferase / 2-methoxy-6-polyprenyl-1,4-benzoquinol methylase